MHDTRLTLIIPAFDRPAFLSRILSYYAQQFCSFDILVADSGPDLLGEKNHLITQSFVSQLHLNYCRFDTRTNLWAKIAQAASSLATPYIAVCDDDDFLVPGSLTRCMEFLDTHPNYAIAQGRAVALAFQKVNAVENALRFSEGLFVHQYLIRSIEDDRPEERLYAHLAKYTGTYNAVHRRNDLIEMTRLAGSCDPNGHMGEILATGLVAIQGKAKMLNHLYLVRHNQPNRAGKKMPGVHDFIKLASYHTDLASMIDSLASHLSSTSGLPFAESRKNVEVSVDAYFKIRLHYPQDVIRYKNECNQWILQLLDPANQLGQDFQPIADLVLQHPDGILSAVTNEPVQFSLQAPQCQYAEECLAAAKRYIERGLINESVAFLVKAILYSINSEEASCLLAKLYILQDKQTAAVNLCQRVLAYNKYSAAAHKLLGDALLARGMAEAAQHYEQALALEPGWRDAHQALRRVRYDRFHKVYLKPHSILELASLLLNVCRRICNMLRINKLLQ